jgi:glycosyltransferase involved in cell wall biosynthesis
MKQMTRDLPRMLLVSEVAFSEESKGASRTLLNLFENYSANQLALFSPRQSASSASLLGQHSFSFPEGYLPPLYGRYAPIGKFLNPLINSTNLQLLEWLPIPQKEKLEAFSPEVILICPISPSCLLMGQKLYKHFGIPFLIYFMDDWMATDHPQWLSSSVQTLTYQLLSDAAGWLMISEPLQETLSKRYQLEPKQSMVVHNPVDLSGKKPPDEEIPNSGTFRIVYAGSIWPMHYDAVAAIAEAVFQLRRDGKDIELILHTDQYFWNTYEDKWQNWEVTNGLSIPYQELDSYLKRANLLLVASSFLPEQSFMTSSSVQTKITDYMAAGRPILSCGPDYSACNKFIKKWDCGLVCETNQVPIIKDFLVEQMNNSYANQRFAKTAFQVLQNNFEKYKVTQQLYQFIETISKTPIGTESKKQLAL